MLRTLKTVRPEADASWAVVVARVGPTAKSRLRGVLEPSERSALASAMLADVLDACAEVFGERVLALVDVQRACEVASAHGVQAVVDAAPGQGMNAAVARGVTLALARGARRVLVLPGDVPLVTPAALGAVLDADVVAASGSVVLIKDRAGSGTNALLLRPPAIIAPAFGPGSAERHLASARAAGAATAWLAEPALALDVDTASDLHALAASEQRGATGALLAEWTRVARGWPLQAQARMRPSLARSVSGCDGSSR
jgi:2-phospho-L-lactate guanylyltransferase